MDTQKIRQDFPILKQQFGGKPIIYFDNACMTLRPRQVIQAVVDYYEKYSGCGERSLHRFGKEVTNRVEDSRKAIAGFLGCKEEHMAFTKNCTEAINMVSHSFPLKSGDAVLTTDKEHNSNLIPWQMLAKKGVKHVVVPAKDDNTFDMEAFSDKLGKEVKLVSVVHTSNLDGVTNPVKEIVEISHDNGAKVLIDGAQSAPHTEISLKNLGADFFAFSGHKMLGPTGIGCLYARDWELLEPFLVGGGTVSNSTYDSQEFLKPPESFEAGLQNYAGILGFGEAVKYLKRIGHRDIEKHLLNLNKQATEGLLSLGAEIIGPQDAAKRSGIVTFRIDGVDSHDAAMILDSTANIMLRSGNYCVHSWFNSRKAPINVRASLYIYNTAEEVQSFLQQLTEVSKLR